MYQMLRRISSSARNRGLCFRRQVQERRLFSNSTTPYLLLHSNKASKEKLMMSIDLFDPRKQDAVKISEQRVSKEVHESVTVASSKGWVCLKNIRDSSLRLINIFNLASSVVSLPPVDVDRAEVSRAEVYSVCLSVSPDKGGDCVVAVTCSSRMLGLCRPGDSEWTYIKTPESIRITKVMFSVTDQTFYIDTVSRLNETETSLFPPVSPYPRLNTHHFRELVNLSTELQNSLCFASPTLGRDTFGVRENCDPEKSGGRSSSRKTKSFIVFRRDPTGSRTGGSFTRDIGNLCIFLGDFSEAFCFSATEYSGLHPNSVYFQSFDSGFGYYDLASLTLHDLTDYAPNSIRYMWLAPIIH